MVNTELYIGLMSGTSIDGVDAALVAITGEQCQLLANHLEPIPAQLTQQLHQLCKPSNDEITQLALIEQPLASLFADACHHLLAKTTYQASDITAVGNHGQTIRHHPEHAFTLQIGDGNALACLTSINTIADFRRKDIALGGQGAPLVPAFHQAVFQHQSKSRAVINIGGLANITFLPPVNTQEHVLGYDTGPGNTLLDAWFKQHQASGKNYDENGQWAASGKINNALLAQLMQDSYLQQSAPKSTGRERYNLHWLQEQINLSQQTDIMNNDVQRTLCYFSALTIANEVHKLMPAGDVYICGGGAANPLLMQDIATALSERYTLASTAALSIDPDWVEAIAFAWLAKRHVHQQPGNLPAVTGASRRAILGSCYLWK